MTSQQKTVILWAVPRSISTAFFRAMMNRTNTKCLLEPYSRAYYFGSERVSSRYETAPLQDGCTFMDIRKQCEEHQPDCNVVFIKDMAYYLADRLDTMQYLPENCIHTFLVRDPHKSVYSLYKMSLNKELTGWDYFSASEVGFKELFQLYELVKKQLGHEPIIIDADDLLKYPEQFLRQYCDKVGIDFQESMINWQETPKDIGAFSDWMPWFEGVLTSTTFQPSPTKPKSPQTTPDLPKHVQRAIDDNMHYYNTMHAKRLRLNHLVG